MSPAHLVNSNHEGLEITEGANSPDVQQHEAGDDGGEQGDGELEVIARNDGLAELLHIELFSFVE